MAANYQTKVAQITAIQCTTTQTLSAVRAVCPKAFQDHGSFYAPTQDPHSFVKVTQDYWLYTHDDPTSDDAVYVTEAPNVFASKWEVIP